MAGQQASNYPPIAPASHVDDLTDGMYWGPTTFSGSPYNTMPAQLVPQNSTQMSNSSEVMQQSIYPSGGSHSASDTLNRPVQAHQLAPSPSQTQPGYLSSTNAPEVPVALTDRLFNLFQAYKEIDPNEHPCMQQIHDFARRTGEAPSVVDYFFHSMREAVKLHVSAQHGLKTPEHTQELPDRHSPAGVGAVLQSRPADFEVPKGRVGGTTRRGRGARDVRREPTNKPRSPVRKRPRIVDTAPVSESNLDQPSAKRQLISQTKELVVKGPPKFCDRFECVSCNRSFKKWSGYTNHETKCHFPYRLFKCNQCEYQCAKTASGRIHLEMTRKHIRYTEKSELDNVFESCCVDATHIYHDACGFCETTFTTREASCSHIREHIRGGCKRSEWTHRCKTAHPFCREPAKVVAAMLAITDHQNDHDDDESGGDGNGDADWNLDGNNTGDEADDAPDDDDGNDDDDDDDGDADDADGGATDSSATDETAPVHEDEGSRNANPGDEWINTCNNNLLRNSSYICHFCRSKAKPEPTHLHSRMHGEHGSQQVILPAADLRHHLGRTKHEQERFRHGRFFKVEVNSQYLSHIPKHDSSPKSVSSVISFRWVSPLGQGAFGTVDEVENPRFPGKTFALKTFKKSSSSWSVEETFSREREALASLRPGHPHLIEFLGSYASESQFCILMSPVANMDLARLLHSRNWSVERSESSWGSRPSVTSQMKRPLGKRAKSLLITMGCLASALRHIHNPQPNGMRGYHFDLKPENILVFEVQDGYQLRVADFGSASFSATACEGKSKALAVTPMYSAPELHTHNSQRRQLERADIWSLGCVFLEMLTWVFGIPIEEFENFRSPDPNDRAFYSKQHQVKMWLAKLRERAQQMGYSFPYLNPYGTIWNMMSNSPEDRPTAKQLESAFPANSCCGAPSNESGHIAVGPQSPSKNPHSIRLLKSINAIEKPADTPFERKTSSYVLPFWRQGRWKEAEVMGMSLGEGHDSDYKDSCGRTPLSYAAAKGQEAVVRLLLARDDVQWDSNDKDGRTPLSLAAEHGHEAVVRLLLGRDDVQRDSKDKDGRTPLSKAAESGPKAVVGLLLKREDDINIEETFSVGSSLSEAPETGHFVARQEELAEIRKTLSGGGSRSTIVLHGLGGIGKTQLALAYAKRRKSDYSTIFWLNSKDQDSLKQSFAKVARRILQEHPGSSWLSIINEKSNLDEVVDAVKRWLDHPKNKRWLIVYDNYDNPKLRGHTDPTVVDLHRFLPESDHGSIIITTRSSEVKLGHRIQVRKLEDIRDSLQILSHTSGRGIVVDDPNAVRLVRKLDGLPLALATAGVHLDQVATSFADYLRLYEESWLKLQQTSPELSSCENRAVYSTWQLSFDHIKGQNELSTELLELLAFFDNQDLWFELLQHGSSEEPEWFSRLTEDEISFNQAMRVLCKYGLAEVDKSSQKSGIESNGYSMHSCVHSWTIHVLNQEWDAEMAEIALKCVGSHVPDAVAPKFWVTQMA